MEQIKSIDQLTPDEIRELAQAAFERGDTNCQFVGEAAYIWHEEIRMCEMEDAS